MSINHCKPPATWQHGITARQSLADGKWHKLIIHVASNFIQCQVDGSSTAIKVKGITRESNGLLFLAGLPDSSQWPILNRNITCFPEVLNFSGCIADLEMNFVNSPGHSHGLNTSYARQFGDISESCTEARDSTVSISDKNSKVMLWMRDDNWCNTSFEFQIRTLKTRAFVGKILNHILTAFFFLEEGNIKVTVRFEELKKEKADSFHLTSMGIFLANNQWHKVSFIADEKVGVNLLIDDELKSGYTLTNKLGCPTLLNTQDSGYSTLRFGRGARKYPSFIGCLRDVYVNNIPVNFTHHVSLSKGVSVGKCNDLLTIKTSSTVETENTENLASLRSTADTFANTKYSDGQQYKASTKPSIASTTGSANISGGNYKILSSDITPQSKSKSYFEKAYPIAIVLAVGLLVIFLVTVYIFGTGFKVRFKKCRDKPAIEDHIKSNHRDTIQVRDKDGIRCQSPANRSKSLRTDDPELNSKCIPHASITNNQSGFDTYQDPHRSLRRLDQNTVKVWEDRHLNNACKASDSNLLTVPQLHFSHTHHSINARSPEKMAKDLENVLGSTSIPQPVERVLLQKQGFVRDQPDANVDYSDEVKGRRVLTVANPSSPKRFCKVYSGHDSLPKSKKAASLSWAYGTRFVRHESSDTDCSDIDRFTRVRPRNEAMESARITIVKPRNLKVLESSEDEWESNKASHRNHFGRGRRPRTFTEETYKLHSLKEDDREDNMDQRLSFNPNRDTYTTWGRNRSTFAEASVRYGDSVAISTQVRSLDGYSSSCPESINCPSEKEDKAGLKITRLKRLTTYYF